MTQEPFETQGGHTPTPWIISRDELNSVDIVIRGVAKNYTGKNNNQIHVAIVTQPPDKAVSWWTPKTLEEAKANANFIVRACNSHNDLLAALEDAVEDIKKLCKQLDDRGANVQDIEKISVEFYEAVILKAKGESK